MRRMIHKRATRQLEAVYEALQGDSTHPFADEIYRRVRKKLPRISLATVYRNLQRLVEDGKIRMVLLGERIARYDPEVSDHDHFVCETCGCIRDLFLERERQMDLAPLAQAGFVVTSLHLTVYGVCHVCSQQAGRPGTNISSRAIVAQSGHQAAFGQLVDADSGCFDVDV
ncbi:MAG TPA: transcriptional repressor [Alphaproteobacteria bacterium]|nr:transcriptional repressor [Alphaproteobacteria bacterium]